MAKVENKNYVALEFLVEEVVGSDERLSAVKEVVRALNSKNLVLPVRRKRKHYMIHTSAKPDIMSFLEDRGYQIFCECTSQYL